MIAAPSILVEPRLFNVTGSTFKSLHSLIGVRQALIVSLLLLASLSSGCSIDVENFKIVHRIDVQQGNILEQSDVDKLRPGMSKNQVRFLLGTPSLVDAFHNDRWDYIYRVKPGGQDAWQKNISLTFKNDKLATINGTIVPQPSQQDANTRSTQVVVVPQVKPEEPGWFEKALTATGIVN